MLKLHLAVLLAAAAVHAADFVPLRTAPARSEPRWERLLHAQVNYLAGSIDPDRIPNELEHAIRPLTATALSAAVCARFAGCDASAKELALRILSGVTRTHRTGGGATASGRPWGHHWQSALWAWQAAFGAWLVWPDVPTDLRRAVLAMTIDEADRFIDLPPPYSRFFDTKAEENAWNALILVLAAEAIDDHPHKQRWRERALEYMISAFATPRDTTSAEQVDGRRLRDWLRGSNIHDDFTLENHGFVHPDYMTTTSLNLSNAVIYRLLGRPIPAAVLRHAPEIYDNLKFFSIPDGSLLYPSGTDWNLHRLDMTAELHVQMERILGDRDAGALAALALASLEKMQSRNRDGRTFVPGEYPSYPTHEPHAGWLYAFAVLTAKLWDPPASPRPLAEVWQGLEGARLLDDARMFVVRAPGAVSSFSWGLRVMGQTVPFTPDPILNPLDHSYAGLAVPLGTGVEAPSRLGIGSAALARAVAADHISISTVIAGRESGAAHVTVRATHSGRPHVFSFTVLPSGHSVYMERWGGTGRALGGMLSFTEEPHWIYGSAKRAIQHDGRTWLNIDGRLGYAISGGGGIRLIPDVRSVLAVLNDDPTADAVIVTLPGATVGQTRQFASTAFRLSADNPDVIAALVSGYAVINNFSPHPLTAAVTGQQKTQRIPINGYSTRVEKW